MWIVDKDEVVIIVMKIERYFFFVDKCIFLSLFFT